MHIYLDPSNLNQAEGREPFYNKTPSKILYKISQVKMFTIVDCSRGYYYIEFDEASSFLTTLNIQFGRFRFIRVLFGLAVVRDAFQCKLDTIFDYLDFCTGIADDMKLLVKEADESNHDRQLTRLLQATKQQNFKLILDMLQFKTEQASSLAQPLHQMDTP